MQHLSPSGLSSTWQETNSHTPSQALLASLRSPIASIEDLKNYLLGVLAALDVVPSPSPTVSNAYSNISCKDVLLILPTIQHVILNTLLPTWLAPLHDAGHVLLVRQLFCPLAPGSERKDAATLIHLKIVVSALPTIISYFPKIISKDPGPTAILSLCLSLVEDIVTAYPIDTIHRCFFSPEFDAGGCSNATGDRRMRDWEDYVRAACSVPGKVTNALRERRDISPKECLEHGPYFSTMSVSTERLIFQISQSSSRGTLLSSQNHLLLKMLNLGCFPPNPPSLPSQPAFFTSALHIIRRRLDSEIVSATSAMPYKDTWAAIVRSFPSTSQQTFLASLLGALDCDVGIESSSDARKKVRGATIILEGLLGTPVGTEVDNELADNEQLWNALMAIVCGPGWTRDIGVLRAITCWIAGADSRKKTVNERALERLLDSTITTWTDPEYIRHSLLSQHRYMTSLILLTLAALPKTSRAPERLALAQPFISCITTYISHLDKSVRRCGMLVAEVVAARCGKKLEFEGWDDANPDLEWVRAMRAWQNDWTVDDQYATEGIADAPPRVTTPPVTPPSLPPPEAEAYDSDDSLTGYVSPPSSSRAPSPTPSDLAEFEKEPSLRVGRKPVARPVYLAQLVEMLRPDRNADEAEAERIAVALTCADGLIRRKKGFGFELEENATELVISLLRLHDNYELPGFNEQRQAALTALVVCCPQKAALTLVQQFFTNQYAVAQRIVALLALALGARELAGLPVPPAQKRAQQPAFPSKMLPPALHRRYAAKEQGQEQIQRLVEGISGNALRESTEESNAPVMRQRQLRVGQLGSTRVTTLTASVGTPQTFTDVAAEYFVMPLVNHMWRHLRGAPGQRARAGAGVVLGPVVMSQFLGTLAVLLHAARHTPAYLAVLAPETLELALVLGRQSLTSKQDKSEDEDETDAAVLTAALEVVLVILDACIALDGGRELGLQRTALLLATGEWARGMFEALEQGRRVRGGGGATEERVGRAVAGVVLKVEQVTNRWARSMVGL